MKKRQNKKQLKRKVDNSQILTLQKVNDILKLRSIGLNDMSFRKRKKDEKEKD